MESELPRVNNWLAGDMVLRITVTCKRSRDGESRTTTPVDDFSCFLGNCQCLIELPLNPVAASSNVFADAFSV